MAQQSGLGIEEVARVRIGNVAATASEVELRALFLKYGRLRSFERPLDPATGRPGTVAYIEMAVDAADAAVAALNGRQIVGQPLEIGAAGRVAEWATRADRHAQSPQLSRTVLPSSGCHEATH
jgi:RNA recognition motif-containing protein